MLWLKVTLENVSKTKSTCESNRRIPNHSNRTIRRMLSPVAKLTISQFRFSPMLRTGGKYTVRRRIYKRNLSEEFSFFLFLLFFCLEENVSWPGLGTQKARTIVSSYRVHDLLEVAGHLDSCSRLNSVNIAQIQAINGCGLTAIR